MSSLSVSLPAGELMVAIKRDFGSFQKMKEKMSAATVAVQGSGWGWLGYEKESGRLRIAACANQDPLQGSTGQLTTDLTVFPQHISYMLCSYILLSVLHMK